MSEEESKYKSHEVAVAKITAVQAVLVALIAVIGTVTVGYLTGKNVSNSGSTTSSGAEKLIANRFVTDRIENSLQETLVKQIFAPASQANDIYYQRLKRSVFLNLLSFQANEEILKRSLKSLTGRGQPITEVQINKLIAEMPELKRTKLRWLEDQAIPALLKQVKSHPEGRINAVPPPFAEVPLPDNAGPPPFAEVPLPDSVRILDQRSGVPTVIVNDLALLKEEVEVLKNII